MEITDKVERIFEHENVGFVSRARLFPVLAPSNRYTLFMTARMEVFSTIDQSFGFEARVSV